MTGLLLLLPVLLPLAGAALALLVRGSVRAQRGVNVATAFLMLGGSIALLAEVWASGPVAVQLGSWEAPVGITFVADLLSAALVVITGIIGAAVAVYAIGGLDEERQRAGFHPLFLVLLMGVNGAFLTGDLFNLYVWFEVLLISSFALLGLGADKEQLRGTVPYVAINLVGSLCFLTGVGLMYGLAGTLNMADLALRLPELPAGPVTAVAMLFLVAFGLKAAVFPLFAWLPPSYPTAPTPIAAAFAGLLTKVGVYALLRTFTLLFTADVGFTHTLLLWIAGATMLTGVLGAAAQKDIRRILSYHIVSQIGYMIMGLALFTPLAIVGAVFYVLHHILVKTNLFLVGGIVDRVGGSQVLAETGGIYRHAPWLAALFVVPAFSLAGFPPLSGFWAKLLLVKAGLDAGAYVIVGVSIVVSVLTLYSMTKIWAQAFWTPHPTAEGLPSPSSRPLWPLVVPAVGLAVGTVAIGLGAEAVLQIAEVAGAQLLDPAPYVEAVLGPEAVASRPP
ncbi:MAG: Na+/H+ antiporter subunit D [Bacteroidota bacterium]